MRGKIKLKNWQMTVSILLLGVSLLPLLYIGRYNVMSADDFSMCKEMHRVVTEGGGIGNIFSYALSYVAKSYQTWIGCYAVSFLDVFNPGVFLMIGFGISMCSPGNSMRQSGTTGMAPVKAILLSFVQALHYAKEWITPLFLLPVCSRICTLPIWSRQCGFGTY